LGQEESSSSCLYDNFLRKAFKAFRKKIAQEQIAQPYSFQDSLVPNPSAFGLRLSFQAEILCVPLFCKLVDHFPGDWIFLLGPIELNDGI
jgi:hypothetical protein